PFSKSPPSSVVLSVSPTIVVPEGATELMPRPESEPARKPDEVETRTVEKSRQTSRLSKRRPRRRSFFEEYGYLIVRAKAGSIVIGARVTAGVMMKYQINKQMSAPAKQK